MFLKTLFLFSLFAKFLGIFFSYQVHIPDRFPPESTVTKVGFIIYSFLNTAIHKMNTVISFFPSFLVPFFEKVSTKIFFLKLPLLFADLVIFVIALLLLIRGRKRVLTFLFFSFLNFWVVFYFDSQSLSFKEELLKFISDLKNTPSEGWG